MATKTALKNKIREIVGSYPLGTPLSADDHGFMLGIFSNHPMWPEKYGAGIASICTRQVGGYGRKTTTCFYLNRHDGTSTDISWTECLRPTPHATKVKLVLRRAITNQVEAYRNSKLQDGYFICEASGERLASDRGEVDHVSPMTFDALVDRFCDEHFLAIDSIGLADHKDGDLWDRLADDTILDLFIDFHAKHAVLRLINKAFN